MLVPSRRTLGIALSFSLSFTFLMLVLVLMSGVNQAYIEGFAVQFGLTPVCSS